MSIIQQHLNDIVDVYFDTSTNIYYLFTTSGYLAYKDAHWWGEHSHYFVNEIPSSVKYRGRFILGSFIHLT